MANTKIALVTGGTGTVGSSVVADLVAHGVAVRVLTRSPEKADLPTGAVPVEGRIGEAAAMRAALDGADGLFLLSPVAADELPGTLLTLSLAQAAGVGAITYLSVIHAERFTDPSHFAAKAAAERMIVDLRLPATILRPGYYLQNDLAERDRILADGVYAPPVGDRGVLVTDTRDLGELGAVTLRRRFEADAPQPVETLDVVAPDVVTGTSIAALWSDLTGRRVEYGGDDLDAFETTFASFAPGWMAHDFRLMMGRFQREGMTAAPGTNARLTDLLGRPMRTYADFAREALAQWGDA